MLEKNSVQEPQLEPDGEKAPEPEVVGGDEMQEAEEEPTRRPFSVSVDPAIPRQ